MNSSSPNEAQRADVFLVEHGYAKSRTEAQSAIRSGRVRINGQIVNKPSHQLAPDAAIEYLKPHPYVSRGALKLAAALDRFDLSPSGLVCLDIGASTGGFTDCLLQQGAKKVYAIDVGHGQLAWKIRSDPRVVVREKLNARFLTRADVPEPIDLCVIDVSFISLTLILPNAFDAVTPNGMVLALIKPQFELEASEVGRGGIVRDAALHEKAREKIRQFVLSAGHELLGIVPSEITGTDGNQEFFICVRKQSA